jgi:FkbM family methyltransferase
MRRRLSLWLLSRMRDRIAGSVTQRSSLSLERIGTAYGGWVVPTAMIERDWIVYCAGVGEDASFDLGLIDRFGCTVFAFDPTPRAIAFAEPIAALEPRFRFMPVGLWSEDVTLQFYAPRDPAHVSHSLLNLQGTTTFFEGPCRSLTSLMKELGHDNIDLLKMDIEGAEHRVLSDLFVSDRRPKVVCTEIDQPVTPWRLWTTLHRIEQGGYECVAIDNWNLTFIREDLLGGFVAD